MNRLAGIGCAALLACGGVTSLGGSGSEAGSTAPAPTASGVGSPDAGSDSPALAAACAWPSVYGDAGAGPGVVSCSAARTLLRCIAPSGAGCQCLTSGELSCEGCGPREGYTCTNQCAADEYVVVCGGNSPAPADASLQPPSPCHVAGAQHIAPTATAPAQVFLYSCCPCG